MRSLLKTIQWLVDIVDLGKMLMITETHNSIDVDYFTIISLKERNLDIRLMSELRFRES